MLGRIISIVIGVSLMLIILFPAAYAYQDIILNPPEKYVYRDTIRPITIHLIMINITDHPINNINPPEGSENLKWVHLVYTYENTGDNPSKGYIDVTFIDSNGNQYEKPKDVYTGESVLPHTTTDPLLYEIAVPKNAELTDLVIKQGFDSAMYPIPRIKSTPLPTIVMSTASIIPQPTVAKNGLATCLPWIPFATVGGLAAAGIVINQSGIRRRR